MTCSKQRKFYSRKSTKSPWNNESVTSELWYAPITPITTHSFPLENFMVKKMQAPSPASSQSQGYRARSLVILILLIPGSSYSQIPTLTIGQEPWGPIIPFQACQQNGRSSGQEGQIARSYYTHPSSQHPVRVQMSLLEKQDAVPILSSKAVVAQRQALKTQQLCLIRLT